MTAGSTPSARPHRTPEGPARRTRAPFALLGAWVVLAAAALGCDHHEPLPKLAEVPDFQLIGQRGEPFRGRDMNGHVWVVDFFFTSCLTYCPMMTEHMVGLHDDLADDGVHFLSISVDPDHDTPEVLRAYAKKHHAAHDDWVFLTGDTEAVADAVVKGFKTPMGEPVQRKSGQGYSIMHARHFLLVDRHRRIRGYYRSDEDGLTRLRDDAARLASGES